MDPAELYFGGDGKKPFKRQHVPLVCLGSVTVVVGVC